MYNVHTVSTTQLYVYYAFCGVLSLKIYTFRLKNKMLDSKLSFLCIKTIFY